MSNDTATPNNVPDHEPLTNTPQVLQTFDQPCAMIPLNVPASEIGPAMGQAVAELGSVLKQQSVIPVGPFYAHHLRIPDTHFELEVCFPVTEPIIASGRVEPGLWPAMTVARTVYEGSYDGLVGAWQEFQLWLASKGHVPDTSRIYERYVVGPNDARDPAEWRTELNIGITH